MKRQISHQVIGYFLVFFIVTLGIITGIHYGTIQNNLLKVELNSIETENAIMAGHIEEAIESLEASLDYLGKDLTYTYEKPIYLIQNFLKTHQGIEAIYLYDENKKLMGSYKEVDTYDVPVANIMKDLFFYTPVVWTELDDSIYCVSHKVSSSKGYSIGFVIDFRKYLEVLSEEPLQQGTLYNAYGRVVTHSVNGAIKNLSEESYKNELLNGHGKALYESGYFLSFRGIEVDGLDLYLIHQRSDQEYQGAMRLYKVKIIAAIGFIITLGFLIAWKLIGKLYGLVVVNALDGDHKAHEFVKIKQELNRAILWIDDVVMHYDELNELKEELIELNARLPKEDEHHVKKAIKKSNKKN